VRPCAPPPFPLSLARPCTIDAGVTLLRQTFPTLLAFRPRESYCYPHTSLTPEAIRYRSQRAAAYNSSSPTALVHRLGFELRPRHACADCALVVPWSRPEHARAAVLALLHTAFAGKLGSTAPACLARLLTGASSRCLPRRP
jgi:hypothetical protein